MVVAWLCLAVEHHGEVYHLMQTFPLAASLLEAIGHRQMCVVHVQGLLLEQVIAEWALTAARLSLHCRDPTELGVCEQ